MLIIPTLREDGLIIGLIIILFIQFIQQVDSLDVFEVFESPAVNSNNDYWPPIKKLGRIFLKSTIIFFLVAKAWPVTVS
jgi:hypothetical protein